jgi:hypothetical protein
MPNFLNMPGPGTVVKLSGKITNYRCTRSSASFIFTKNDQHTMGVIAVAAAIAGIGGQAVSVAGYASNMEETAEFLEFLLDGYPMKGWVWRSPFSEGDIIDVAAEWQGHHYEVYGIVRPVDKMIALYPHCSRSKKPHIKNAAKWCLIFNTLFFSMMAAWFAYIGGPGLLLKPEILWVSFGVFLCLTLIFVKLTKQYMPFVILSEKVFSALNLANTKNIDLIKSSKIQRTANDSPEFGTFYYRY